MKKADTIEINQILQILEMDSIMRDREENGDKIVRVALYLNKTSL